MPTVLYSPPGSPTSGCTTPRRGRIAFADPPSISAHSRALSDPLPHSSIVPSIFHPTSSILSTPTMPMHQRHSLGSSTSSTSALSSHTASGASSPVLRSTPLVNPATANIVIPEIILNSPPASRRGSATAMATAAGVLHGLGLSVATLPSLAQFRWKNEAQRKKDEEAGGEHDGEVDDRHSEDEDDRKEWDVEARRSRSTDQKFILPSHVPNMQQADAASRSPSSGNGTHHSARSYTYRSKAKGKGRGRNKKRFDWRHHHPSSGEEDETAAWIVIFMIVAAVIAMAGLSSLLSSTTRGSDFTVTGRGGDKVLGWGGAEGGRRWHVRHAGEVLNKKRNAHTGLDWEDSLHHDHDHDVHSYDAHQAWAGPYDTRSPLDDDDAIQLALYPSIDDGAEVHHEP